MENITFSNKEIFEKAIEKVIDSSKYKHLQEGENIRDGIAERIGEFFSGGSTGGYTSNSISTAGTQNTFFLLFFIVAIALLYYALKSPKSKLKKEQVIYGEVIDENTTYEGLYKKALLRQQEEKYVEAVRLYFVSLLFYMNEKSLCLLDESRTNAEIIRALHKAEFTKADIFKNISDYFQYIWYGNKEVKELDFQHYRQKIEDLLMEVEIHHEKQ
ncbi:MAG: hypothetical protein JJT76_00320 [Clostridiaceae bacterium]|nr:hypothetical protein [Clostridiaceae bacterium]